MEGVKDQRLCLKKSDRDIGRETRISGRRHQEKEVAILRISEEEQSDGTGVD